MYFANYQWAFPILINGQSGSQMTAEKTQNQILFQFQVSLIKNSKFRDFKKRAPTCINYFSVVRKLLYHFSQNCFYCVRSQFMVQKTGSLGSSAPHLLPLPALRQAAPVLPPLPNTEMLNFPPQNPLPLIVTKITEIRAGRVESPE